jgi:hypothetical protein
VRLKGTEPSTNFKDNTWLPEPARLINFLTGLIDDRQVLQGYQRANDSYVNNPYADLNNDEISMVKSGASYKDIMFLRAMRNQNKEGFSPYFNPNRK